MSRNITDKSLDRLKEIGDIKDYRLTISNENHEDDGNSYQENYLTLELPSGNILKIVAVAYDDLEIDAKILKDELIR